MRAKLKEISIDELVFIRISEDPTAPATELVIPLSKTLEVDCKKLQLDVEYILREATDGYWEIHTV